MSKPIAVLISDIHYNIHTLSLADAALRQAINKANDLDVPLIIAGDIHDTKANLRGECVNAMIDTFKLAKQKPKVIIGNHDRLNEKNEKHSLSFLSSYAVIYDTPNPLNQLFLIPYSHDPELIKATLNFVDRSYIIIMHQGITGSDSGDYIQDKSALNKEDVSGFRVVSGHYHRRQTIELPDGGKWDYIGNPYTLGWGEANDPKKGFQILMDDGNLQFVPTNLRKHLVYECEAGPLSLATCPEVKSGDLLWIKVRDSKENLKKCTKNYVRGYANLNIDDFKLDLIPTNVDTKYIKKTQELTQVQLLDDLIDHKSISEREKELIKNLWRSL